MQTRSRTAQLPFSAERLFDLVADIESYPDFVPGYQQAQIIKQDAGEMEVEQRVGIGPLALRFRSRARLERPSRLEVHTTDIPFGRMRVRWSFSPSEDGTRVTFESEYPKNSEGQRVVSWLWDLLDKQVFNAFRKEAVRRYG